MFVMVLLCSMGAQLDAFVQPAHLQRLSNRPLEIDDGQQRYDFISKRRHLVINNDKRFCIAPKRKMSQNDDDNEVVEKEPNSLPTKLTSFFDAMLG